MTRQSSGIFRADAILCGCNETPECTTWTERCRKLGAGWWRRLHAGSAVVTDVPHWGAPVWGAARSRWEVTRLSAQFLKTSLIVVKIYVWFYHLDHFLSSEAWSTFTLWSDHHHHQPPELSHRPVLKLFSTQFCCETKTAPKNKVYWLKTKNRERGTYMGKQQERRQQQDAGSRKADEQKMT